MLHLKMPSWMEGRPGLRPPHSPQAPTPSPGVAGPEPLPPEKVSRLVGRKH